jgi:3-oxoacyl-[acyl-carrier protein] reductase
VRIVETIGGIFMDLDLEGKVAAVGGASRGIGLAIAEGLAAEGCSLVIAGRSETPLAEAAARISKGMVRVEAVSCDLTTAEGARALVETARSAFGRLDVLVNNVGGSRGNAGWEAPDDDWAEAVDVNLYAAVRTSREAIPLLKESGGGRIVNVSSIFGREWGGAVSYNAAKAALNGYTKSLSRLLMPDDIQVNAVAPGSTLFPGGSWDRKLKADPEKIEAFIQAEIPGGRLGRVEEIADAVVFLCSRARAGWITGVCLNVDGGQSRSLI